MQGRGAKGSLSLCAYVILGENVCVCGMYVPVLNESVFSDDLSALVPRPDRYHQAGGYWWELDVAPKE